MWGWRKYWGLASIWEKEIRLNHKVLKTTDRPEARFRSVFVLVPLFCSFKVLLVVLCRWELIVFKLVFVSVTAPKKVTLFSFAAFSLSLLLSRCDIFYAGKALLHGCLLLVIVGLLNVSMWYVRSYVISWFGKSKYFGQFAPNIDVSRHIFEFCSSLFLLTLMLDVFGSVLLHLCLLSIRCVVFSLLLFNVGIHVSMSSQINLFA